MSRPRLPDDQLLHPRRERSSVVSSVATHIPRRTAKEIKHMRLLVSACIAAVSTNDRIDNIAPKTKIILSFKDYLKERPKDFPVGRLVEREGKSVKIQYNAEAVLLWLHDKGYTQYTAHDVYAKIRDTSSMIREIDKPFDIDRYLLDNFDLDIAGNND